MSVQTTNETKYYRKRQRHELAISPAARRLTAVEDIPEPPAPTW